MATWDILVATWVILVATWVILDTDTNPMSRIIVPYCGIGFTNLQSLTTQGRYVERLISSYASYDRCRGTQTQLEKSDFHRSHLPSKKCVISIHGDVFERFGNTVLTKNRVSIQFTGIADFGDFIDFTISNDATKIFLLHPLYFFITVHLTDGTFVCEFEIPIEPNSNRDINTIDMNKNGQLVLMYISYSEEDGDDSCGSGDCNINEVGNNEVGGNNINNIGGGDDDIDSNSYDGGGDAESNHRDDVKNTNDHIHVRYVLVSTNGELISKTLLRGQGFHYDHDIFLISPEIIDGNIFVAVTQHNAIHVFDSQSGKCIRKMYYVRPTSTFPKRNLHFGTRGTCCCI